MFGEFNWGFQIWLNKEFSVSNLRLSAVSFACSPQVGLNKNVIAHVSAPQRVMISSVSRFL